MFVLAYPPVDAQESSQADSYWLALTQPLQPMPELLPVALAHNNVHLVRNQSLAAEITGVLNVLSQVH